VTIRLLVVWSCAAVIGVMGVQAWSIGQEKAEQSAERTLVLHPIGVVQKSNDRTRIVLEEKYQPGLLGLDGFSHIQVLWWFDQNDTPEKRAILQVHPRGDRSNPLTGVFATRSPFRPNLIALTTCKIVGIQGNVIDVENVDAFDGTPVLDIKPYLPGLDSESDIRLPAWAKPQ
jgi:tRNA-Thr(GGU) m(6)t(6)A37 methyltransferase TsaA